jgi:hypothetical protein
VLHGRRLLLRLFWRRLLLRLFWRRLLLRLFWLRLLLRLFWLRLLLRMRLLPLNMPPQHIAAWLLQNRLAAGGRSSRRCDRQLRQHQGRWRPHGSSQRSSVTIERQEALHAAGAGSWRVHQPCCRRCCCCPLPRRSPRLQLPSLARQLILLGVCCRCCCRRGGDGCGRPVAGRWVLLGLLLFYSGGSLLLLLLQHLLGRLPLHLPWRCRGVLLLLLLLLLLVLLVVVVLLLLLLVALLLLRRRRLVIFEQAVHERVQLRC